MGMKPETSGSKMPCAFPCLNCHCANAALLCLQVHETAAQNIRHRRPSMVPDSPALCVHDSANSLGQELKASSRPLQVQLGGLDCFATRAFVLMPLHTVCALLILVLQFRCQMHSVPRKQSSGDALAASLAECWASSYAIWQHLPAVQPLLTAAACACCTYPCSEM